MPIGDWVITITGALIALAGVGVIHWALLADRLRTRPARRAGALRRCPRCWYDMAATAGLRCPECGREARRERSLQRSRRRWRRTLAAMPVLAAGAGGVLFPHSTGGAWKRWLPDTALILLIPHTTNTGWAAEELALRLGMWGAAPSVSTGRELSKWQQRLLTESCAGAIERARLFPPRPMAWWLIMCSSPNPESACEPLVRELGNGDPKLRLWAALCLDRTRFFLSDEQLAVASQAILASPSQPREFDEEMRIGHAAAIDRQLRSRRRDGHAARAAVIAAMPISPGAIIHALDGKSVNELIALHRRLGVRRTSLFDADESLQDAMRVESIEQHIDHDAEPDCILSVHNRYWERAGCATHYEAFMLLRRGDGWRFLGMMDLSNTVLHPPQFSAVTSDDGQRWLVVRADGGASGDGSYFIKRDAWYRVRADRLVPEQAVMPRAFSSSRFHQTLEAAEPKVIRRGGRFFAAYDITSTISLAVPSPNGAERLLPIASDRGAFEYPLGVPDSKLGRHVPPGPWNGRDCWWAILDDPQLLPVYRGKLLALARSGEPEVQAALQEIIDDYLTFVDPESAPGHVLAELQAALAER
ncbi:MAG TPA: hypothetical protein VFF69_09880 [Phycisphaerales bacterium]|nr:hypothetical protein [Phycisphaerales bacterium]